MEIPRELRLHVAQTDVAIETPDTQRWLSLPRDPGDGPWSSFGQVLSSFEFRWHMRRFPIAD